MWTHTFFSILARIRARCRKPRLGPKSGKPASDRAKWRTYVHSHISGTQVVNTPPFCAGTQAFVPGHQVWTALSLPQLSNKRVSHKKVRWKVKSKHTVYEQLAFNHVEDCFIQFDIQTARSRLQKRGMGNSFNTNFDFLSMYLDVGWNSLLRAWYMFQ